MILDTSRLYTFYLHSVVVMKRLWPKATEGKKGLFFAFHFRVKVHRWEKPGQDVEGNTAEEHCLLACWLVHSCACSTNFLIHAETRLVQTRQKSSTSISNQGRLSEACTRNNLYSIKSVFNLWFLWDRVSLRSLGWPETRCIKQSGLEFTGPASASQLLALTVLATLPGNWYSFSGDSRLCQVDSSCKLGQVLLLLTTWYWVAEPSGTCSRSQLIWLYSEIDFWRQVCSPHP
jgi:hypothetical protein